MKASDLFVKALENEGVEYIFGIPGEENLDLLESIRKSNIKLILTRHEQSAGFMASTYGRLTGNPGVCLSTLGPGATNLVTPAAYAQLGAMPMIMITGQKPIKISKQGRFQIIDVCGMMKPITKYTRQIVNAHNIPSAIRESFRIAKEERPGAVHIELPEDIAVEKVENMIFNVVDHRRPDADDVTINKAVKMIESAKHPLILIGADANRTRTSQALTELIKKTNIPFFNTQMGKGIVDERHKLFLGTAAISDNDFVHCAIKYADLIINVGHDIIEKPPFIMADNKKNVIHINFSPAKVDSVYFPQLNIVGDIATSVKSITKKIKNSDKWDLLKYKTIKEDIDLHLSKYVNDERFPILPQKLIKILRDNIPDDGIITLDNGIYKLLFSRNYKCYKPNTLLLDNALATMGAGLPSAIATKIIKPECKVISVSGDGGFLMNSQELETAVRLKLDLIVIILNDNGYGMIKWKQKAMGFENFGLEFNNPNFVKLAESYGANGYKPKSVEEFKEIFNSIINKKGIHLIDLSVDYSLNDYILNGVMKNKKCI